MDITSYKLQYIEYKIKNQLESSKEYNLVLNCDSCQKKIRIYIHISSTHRILKIISDGIFHHLNGNRNDNRIKNINLFCRGCHRNTHDWGFSISNLPKDYEYIPLTHERRERR